MNLTIRTKSLVKRYGSRTVVNDVSFEVSQGEIVGLLGPNGAGKTTSFYQVVGLVKSDSGEVFLNDINIVKEIDVNPVNSLIDWETLFYERIEKFSKNK